MEKIWMNKFMEDARKLFLNIEKKKKKIVFFCFFSKNK